MRTRVISSTPHPQKRHSSPLPPPLLRLPRELLCISFSSLARHDLASVVRVCRSFRDTARVSLYQRVELNSELANVLETFKLLGTNVGAYVHEMVLITTSPRTPAQSAWFPPSVVQYWIKLRRLEMYGVPFVTSEDVDVFRTNLRAHCLELQVMSYRHDVFEDFPVGELDLLERSRATVDHALDSVSANKSVHCLTHVALTGDVVHYVGSPFDTFLDLRLPNLRSLELGTLVNDWTRSVPHTETTHSVTRFVSAHGLLEHLSLGKRAPQEGQSTSFFHLEGALITPQFLPQLRSFEGCPRTLTSLARQRVRSIYSLASLSLLVDAEDHSGFSAMIKAIKSSPAESMPTVQNLNVDFSSRASVHEVPLNTVSMAQSRCLDGIADMCPKVIYWSGCLPAMNADQLAVTFRLFQDLETISLPWYTLLIHMKWPKEPDVQPSCETSYFGPLARSLHSLKAVTARKPLYSKLMDQYFTFVRDPSGELTQVVREAIRL